MSKFTKGFFKMGKQGIQFEGVFSPWMRFCIGVAIILLAVVPLIHAIRWW